MATTRGGAGADGLTARRMARTRARLADAAARMFRARGYEATTVEDICAQVEVSPRTFFRYFSSKEDVLDEVLESHLDGFVQALAERPAGEAVLDSLVAAATHGYAAAGGEPDFLELFAVVHRTPALRARWLDRGHEVQARLAEVLAGRLAAGGGRVAVLAAGALTGTLTAVIESWAEDPGGSPLRQQVVEALEQLAAGFGLAGTAPGGSTAHWCGGDPTG